MTRPRIVARVAVIVLVLSGSTPSAQTRIQIAVSGVTGIGCQVFPEPPPTPLPCERRRGQILEIDVDSASLVSTTSMPEQATEPRLTVTSDGRYVVWATQDDRRPGTESARTLSYLDRLTGQVTQGFRQAWPIGQIWAPRAVFAHPTELRAFVQFPSGGLDAGAAGIRETLFVPFAIAPDGSASVEFGVGTDIQIRDRTTGAARCSILQAGPAIYEFAFAPDGETLYALRTNLFAGTMPSSTLSRIDARNCSVLQERPGPGLGEFYGVDPSTGRLFLGGASQGALLVVDPVTLVTMGEVAGVPGALSGIRLAFEPHRARAYRLVPPHTTDTAPFANRVDAIDTWQLIVLGSGTLSLDRRATDIAVVPVPPAPTLQAATVTGTDVMLRWLPGPGPGLASEYRLEAGAAPGLTDIAMFQQADTTFVARGVPAGAYFVRVRALNAGGLGPPSGEQLVTVR